MTEEAAIEIVRLKRENAALELEVASWKQSSSLKQAEIERRVAEMCKMRTEIERLRANRFLPIIEQLRADNERLRKLCGRYAEENRRFVDETDRLRERLCTVLQRFEDADRPD